MATSKEIKNLLVTKYGYSRKDLINPDTGKDLPFKKLESLLKKEESKVTQASIDDISLDEFNEEVRKVDSVQFNDSDMITVMSGITGKLVHYSSAGNGVFTFNSFGERQEMPFKELKSISNVARKTLENGLIIILNKDVIKELRLESIYQSILTPTRASDLLDSSFDVIKGFLDKSSRETKITFLDYARTKYNVGELDSMSLIKSLEDYYNISFENNLSK